MHDRPAFDAREGFLFFQVTFSVYFFNAQEAPGRCDYSINTSKVFGCTIGQGSMHEKQAFLFFVPPRFFSPGCPLLIPQHGDILDVFLEVVPLGMTSRLVPVHNGLACPLYITCCMHPLLNCLPLHGLHKETPRASHINVLRPISMNQPVALRRTPPKPPATRMGSRLWAQAYSSNHEQSRKLGSYSTASATFAHAMN